MDTQVRVPIVKFCDEGLPASVDGLRFVVPKRTVNAGLRDPATVHLDEDDGTGE
ncbi:hypothetical protein ACU639_01220 [Streptomyces cynarae]|uniref:hypothetical protein n=1 Tax=Streptomyces cynarae TaxID=2981134 RepID=UPI00406C0ECA